VRFLLVLTLLGCTPRQKLVEGSLFEFRMRSIGGQEVDFSVFRGKYLLIVNTASKCGFTPQYKDLQQLQETYSDRLTVLGFPANNFLWQEPGTNDEIASFCSLTYGVTFPMFEKISVKGRDKHPLYQWLEKESGESPSWNFCKYLVSPEGKVMGFYPSKVKPTDPVITRQII
jgi:glutathione peroxidase